MALEIERRNSKRVELSFPLRYQHKGTQQFGNTIGKDISDCGIGFISNEFFAVSSQLVFEIQLPSRQLFIKAVGEVVWISNQPYSEKFSVGAKFHNPPLTI